METTQEFLISTTADIAGINPKSYIKKPGIFTVESIEMFEREAKDGGTFKQYTIHVKDEEQKEKRVSFLFARNLSPLARAWGENPADWKGKTFELMGVQGDKYVEVELKAVE